MTEIRVRDAKKAIDHRHTNRWFRKLESPDWQWVGLGILMLAGVTVIASLVKNLGLMFDLIEGILCSAILYFFPVDVLFENL
jgi:hypothetical protein